MLFGDTTKIILVYDTISNEFTNKYKNLNTYIYVNHMVYSSSDYLFFFGRKITVDDFYSARAHVSAVDSLLYVENNSLVSVSPIRTNFALNVHTPNPSLTLISPS